MGILAIETSSHWCSVAFLFADRQLVRHELISNQASQMLLPWIHELMQANSLSWDAIERIAVSIGPGAFTGIRLGVGIAHGMVRVFFGEERHGGIFDGRPIERDGSLGLDDCREFLPVAGQGECNKAKQDQREFQEQSLWHERFHPSLEVVGFNGMITRNRRVFHRRTSSPGRPIHRMGFDLKRW